MSNSTLALRDAAVAISLSRERTASVRWALTSLSLSMLMPSLDTSIANAGLPALAAAFNASFQDVQWIVLAYLLAVTTLIVSVGKLGDVVGRRRLLLAGTVVFTAASLLCGLAPTLWMLIVARSAQGLGAAVMMALAVAFVGDTVPQAKIGSAMGLLGTMSAVGTTLGPSLGGVLIAKLGWGAIFLVNVPVGVLTLVLAHRHLPVDRPASKAERARFDYVGTSLLALTLAAYALAMTLGRGHFGPLNVMLLLAAVCGVGLLVLVEARAASPLIRVAMFREPALRAGLGMSALVSTVMMTTLVVGPFYLFRALGLAAVFVGFVLSAGPLVAALTGVPAGRIVDRFGAQRMTVVGLVGIICGASALSMLPARFGVVGYIAPIVVMTASYALFQAANNTAIMTAIRPDQRGAIAGMLGLSRNLGLITGASVMGAVFALASTSSDITTARPEAIAAGMRFTFAFAAILIVVALALAAKRHFHHSSLTIKGHRTMLSRRSEWRVPALLILLSLVPAVAGTVRLAELAGGAEVTEANARFFATPLPVVLHILAVIPYSILGAFQFAPAFRRRRPAWHRAAGRVLVVAGLVTALTGLWMAYFYPWPEGDGELLYMLRVVFGSAMAMSIVLALDAIRRRDFGAHGAWMIRGYAIGMGAGTQVLTHLPYFIFVGKPDELSRTVLTGAGWVINLIVAESIIRREPPGSVGLGDGIGFVTWKNEKYLRVTSKVVERR